MSTTVEHLLPPGVFHLPHRAVHRKSTELHRCVSTGLSATVEGAGGAVAAAPRLADPYRGGADMAEPTRDPETPHERALRLRCEAISQWWRHAAEGTATIDLALEATAAHLFALDEERRRA